jgi:glycosyltransferase involved in cell wall biosynthesis
VLRLALVVPSLGIGGGNAVVLSHARVAAEAGHDVTVVVSGDGDGVLAPTDAHPTRAVSLDHAVGQTFDVAVASWWQDVFHLPKLRAARHVEFVQGPEDRLYSPDEPESDPLSYDLVRALYRIPLRTITVSDWLADYLRQEHGRGQITVVKNGIDKSVFRPDGPSIAARDPRRLRVLVEGPLGVGWKNVVPALRLSRPIADETWLVTSTRVGRIAGLDRVFSRLAPAEVASVQRSCDVLLKLSIVEGLSLPPLEMFHCGGPCIVFRGNGVMDYVVHGRNALISDPGDFPSAADQLSSLKRDRGLLELLREGALETAASWPTEVDAGLKFVAVLEEVAAEGPAGDADALEQVRSLAARHPAPVARSRHVRIRDRVLVRSLRHSIEILGPQKLSRRSGANTSSASV